MPDLVIDAEQLRKQYRTLGGTTRWAVDGVDLRVARGDVHGFLGPNGSGKTSTIRMLLGLTRATSGTMRLFGEPVPERQPAVMGRIGAVVESPKFSPGLTGRHNLLLLSRSVGIADSKVDHALEAVGLTHRAKQRYKGYSLGMKQRLAVAATLLRDPELLILDEPSNGLDPAGIRENREMIRSLAERGVTVLLSSHVLAEVQQVCTAVTILGRGRTLAAGPVSDLLTPSAGVRLVPTDVDRAVTVLEDAALSVRHDDGTLVVDGTTAERVSELLAGSGVWLRELAPVRRDLESVYLELTAGQDLAAEGAA